MLQPSTTGTVHNGQSPDPPDGWALGTAVQQGDRDNFCQLYQRYPGGVPRFVDNRLSAHHRGKR